MTIAAGVWCSDGLVICADTEVNDGQSKYQRPKIFSYDDWLLVTGSGWFDYLEMAADKLRERFQAERPEDAYAARKAVERTVLSIYERNIGRVFHVGDPQSPSFDLIVGIRCGDDRLALIKSSITSVALSKTNAIAVGSGWPLFEYWGRYFFPVPKNMDVTSYFCMFILREIKQSAFGCGGGTHVFKLPADSSHPKRFTHVFSESDLLAGFPQTAVNIVLDAADGAKLDFSIGLWRQQLEQLGQHFKSHAEQEERMRKGFEETREINKPPEGT